VDVTFTVELPELLLDVHEKTFSVKSSSCYSASLPIGSILDVEMPVPGTLLMDSM
jgi:hypothetical protein